MILVTGATGLVGSHMLYRLAQKGVKVRAIYREKTKLANLDKIFGYYTKEPQKVINTIEWFQSEINDLPSLEAAFQGVTHVYHIAGMISFAPNDYKVLKKVNAIGTAHVVNLCLKYKVNKLVHVSSIAALGDPPPNSKVTDETAQWNSDGDNHVYAITKYRGEMEVWRGIYEGLNAVIVNPGIILGPGFWNSGSGKFFSKTYKGFAYFTESITGYIGVCDVVKSLEKLMDSKKQGERYILVSENRSFKEIASSIANGLQRKRPYKKVTQNMVQVAWRADWLTHKLFGKTRQLSKIQAKTMLQNSFYSNRKIKKELSIEFQPIDDVIASCCKTYLKDLA